MKPARRGPILAFVGLYLFIVSIAQDADALPYRTDAANDTTDRFPNVDEKPSNPEAVEQRSDDDRGPRTRDRRDATHKFSKTSNKSFTDLEDVQSDAIVFPEDDGSRRVPVCEGSTYCEKVDGYPERVVTEALQRNESLKYLATVDEVSDVVQRINVNDDVPLCISTEQVIYPQSAENKDNQWKYIANQDNFKQGVRIEKCSNENAKCNVIGGPGVGYKTSCRQRYVYRQLTAVLPDGSMVSDTFKFPSSCCCHVSFTGSAFTRMGLNMGERESDVTPIQTRMRKRSPEQDTV